MGSHKNVTIAWNNGKKCTGTNMFTDGKTIYSYGEHFPVATKIQDIILFNTDKYSSSTSNHQTIVRSHCSDIIECNTKEIIKAIDNPTDPIVITKIVKHETVRECLENMKEIFNKKGKRFPMKKLSNNLMAEMI